MPPGRRPEGERPLTNAERQARYRARHAEPANPVNSRLHRPPDRRSRPQRWRDAIAELLTLQAEYEKWLAVIPESLHASATCDALQAIVGLDLTILADVEPPRGYGRD